MPGDVPAYKHADMLANVQADMLAGRNPELSLYLSVGSGQILSRIVFVCAELSGRWCRPCRFSAYFFYSDKLNRCSRGFQVLY